MVVFEGDPVVRDTQVLAKNREWYGSLFFKEFIFLWYTKLEALHNPFTWLRVKFSNTCMNKAWISWCFLKEASHVYVLSKFTAQVVNPKSVASLRFFCSVRWMRIYMSFPAERLMAFNRFFKGLWLTRNPEPLADRAQNTCLGSYLSFPGPFPSSIVHSHVTAG